MSYAFRAVADLAVPLRRNPSLRFGFVLLGALVLFAIVGSFALADPVRQDLGNTYAPPSLTHPFGTDQLGRDVFSWVASGIVTGLKVSCGVVLFSALLGTVIGLTAGYFGGFLDSLLMRFVDLQLAIPPLLLFLAASAVLTTDIVSLIVLLSVVGWVPYARIVRTKILTERKRAYVAAARLAGASRGRILFLHLLPSTATQVFVLASLQAGFALLWESGLSFLGLGLQPPTISLGFQIAEGRSLLDQAWWIVTFPGLAIVLLILAFNSLGDGLRDVFNLDVDVIGR